MEIRKHCLEYLSESWNQFGKILRVRLTGMQSNMGSLSRRWNYLAPDFKDKTRYTLYVSLGSQISHIATNKGNIKRQYLLHNVLVIEKNNLGV